MVLLAIVIQLIVLAEAVTTLLDVYPTYKSENCTFFSSLNTSAVDTLDNTFRDSNLVCDGEPWRWDVSGVITMSNTFSNASFNADISSWDVSGVTTMYTTFDYAQSFNANISSWDVSGVITMHTTFGNAHSFNADISSWDVSGVITMYNTFGYAQSFNADISSWDVSGVTTMDNIFGYAQSFNANISNWDVSRVTTLFQTFINARVFNGDVSRWDLSQVTTLTSMFYKTDAFNGDMSRWDVSRVTSLTQVFTSAAVFNGNIGSWDVSNVGSLRHSFSSASAFRGDLSSWDVSQVTQMVYTFLDCNFTGDLRSWCVTAVLAHDYFCSQCIEPIWGTCPTATPTSPTATPTDLPSSAPTSTPSTTPTTTPTTAPTHLPTNAPTSTPSTTPTTTPTTAFTHLPTNVPTSTPSMTPTMTPTNLPTNAEAISTICNSLTLPNAPNGSSLRCGAADAPVSRSNGGEGVGDVVSPVVSIILLNLDGEEIHVLDLSPVVFTLTQTNSSSVNPSLVRQVSDPCKNNQAACAWWDGDHDRWSFEGCTTLRQQQQEFQCRCTHLTEFALVVRAVDSLEPVCGVPDPSPGHIALAVLYGLAGVVACLQAVRLTVAATDSKKHESGLARLIVQHIGMALLCVVRVLLLAFRVAPPRPSAVQLVALASVSYTIDVLLFNDLVWTFLAAVLSMKEQLLGRLTPVFLVLCGVIVVMLVILPILVAVLPRPTKVHVAIAASYIMASVVGFFSLCVLVSGMMVVRLICASAKLTTSRKPSVASKLAWCTILLSLSLALGSVCWVLSIQRPLQTSTASRNFALAIELTAYGLGLFNVTLLLYLRFASVNHRAVNHRAPVSLMKLHTSSVPSSTEPT